MALERAQLRAEPVHPDGNDPVDDRRDPVRDRRHDAHGHRDRPGHRRDALDLAHGRRRPHGERAPGELRPRRIVLGGRSGQRAYRGGYPGLPHGSARRQDRLPHRELRRARYRRSHGGAPLAGRDRHGRFHRGQFSGIRGRQRHRRRIGAPRRHAATFQDEHTWRHPRVRRGDRRVDLDLQDDP